MRLFPHEERRQKRRQEENRMKGKKKKEKKDNYCNGNDGMNETIFFFVFHAMLINTNK